ncbi:hypothetical protein CHN49_08125 [Pseudomonas putida]|nr:hypothetical protein CHN49_08125 [Pseudomonas putida]
MQVLGHGLAHDAGADETDFSHERLPLCNCDISSKLWPPVGAGSPAKQTTRWMAPALPVFAGEPAPTGSRVVPQIALWVFSQPRPASVVVLGLYSAPTQPW